MKAVSKRYVSGFVIFLAFWATQSRAQDTQSIQFRAVQLTDNVNLVQPNGSSIVLPRDGTLAGAEVMALEIGSDGSFVLRSSRGSALLGYAALNSARNYDGVSLQAADRSSFATIRRTSIGEVQTISSAAAVSCGNGQQRDQLSFVKEKTDGYEIDLASGQGSIYFDLTVDQNPWQQGTPCQAAAE